MDINKKMQDAFNKQITMELYSSHLYLAMAYWFRKEGWHGFAKWMLRQAEEEKGHALGMANFIVDRGGEVEFSAIEAVKADFKDPQSVFENTLKHEQHVTTLINKLADIAEEEHDRASMNFIDRYIDEQVEEEKSVRDIIHMFCHHDGHTVANIDDILGGKPQTV
jgi:ferritin